MTERKRNIYSVINWSMSVGTGNYQKKKKECGDGYIRRRLGQYSISCREKA